MSSTPPIRFNSLEEKQTRSNGRSGAMVQNSQSSYITVLEPTQIGRSSEVESGDETAFHITGWH